MTLRDLALKIHTLFLLPLCILLLGFSLLARGQDLAASSEDIYAPIPDSQRKQFRTALEELLALERAGNWADVYDRLYLNDQGLSRAQFVAHRHHLKLVTFTPTRITWFQPTEEWVISGCAVLSPRPPIPGVAKKKGVVSDFDAKPTATGWRFSAPPAIVVYCEPPLERTCNSPN